jgi:hypothetical protein
MRAEEMREEEMREAALSGGESLERPLEEEAAPREMQVQVLRSCVYPCSLATTHNNMDARLEVRGAGWRN